MCGILVINSKNASSYNTTDALNEINGLENPTLENIGLYIYSKLKEVGLNLYKILVKRKSCGETFILKV